MWTKSKYNETSFYSDIMNKTNLVRNFSQIRFICSLF